MIATLTPVAALAAGAMAGANVAEAGEEEGGEGDDELAQGTGSAGAEAGR